MKRNGFTLIELLAVIVILAVIAVIAVPIVIDIIDDTKKNALEQSSNMYKKALETTIANEMMKDTLEDGIYVIDNDGNIRYKNKTIKVEIQNYEFESGIVEIKDGNIAKTTLFNDDEIILDGVIQTFDIWDGSIKEVTPDSEGAYHITKVSELAWVSQQVKNNLSNFEGSTIYLESNLDLNNIEWIPIDNPNNYFKGILEGNNNIIKNLKIEKDITNSGNSYLGLFGGIENGKITNLNIYNSYVSGYAHVSILCADSKNSFIENVNIYNSEVKSTKVAGVVTADFRKNSIGENINVYFSTILGSNLYIGGVIGQFRDASLNKSFSNAIVNNDLSESNSATGGIIGGIVQNGIVSNVISNATVKAGMGAGGIIGQFQQNATLKNSISYAYVEGQNKIGGVIGADVITNETINNLENIESYATVIGTGEYIGGVVAHISQGEHNYINIYSKAIVQGNDKVGSIVGGFTSDYKTTLNYKNIISESNVTDLYGYRDTTNTSINPIVD